MRSYPNPAPARGNETPTTTYAHPNQQLNGTWCHHQHHPTQRNHGHGHEIPLVTLQNKSKTVPDVLVRRFNKPSRLCHKTSRTHSSSYHTCPVSHHPNQNGATMTETSGHALPHQTSLAISTDNTTGSKRHITHMFVHQQVHPIGITARVC